MPLWIYSRKINYTVETSVQYSIQKYDHLTADRVMTANIKSLVFLCNYDTFSILKEHAEFFRLFLFL